MRGEYGCWETQRNGQVIIKNGEVIESFDGPGYYGLFSDIEHPVPDLFVSYLRERTLAQAANDRLHDAVGIVRALITIMDDERFKNSPSTPYSDVRGKKQTEKVRSELATLVETMATKIGQINFQGVLLEEGELREGILQNSIFARDLIKTLGVAPLVQESGSAARFAILPFASVINKNPYLSIVPVLHYVNADKGSGRYANDANGLLLPMEWELRYVSFRPLEVRQIRRLPDDNQNPFDIDIIRTISNTGIGYEFSRASNKARWKANRGVVQEVERAAVEMAIALAAKVTRMPGITICDDFQFIEATRA